MKKIFTPTFLALALSAAMPFQNAYSTKIADGQFVENDSVVNVSHQQVAQPMTPAQHFAELKRVQGILNQQLFASCGTLSNKDQSTHWASFKNEFQLNNKPDQELAQAAKTDFLNFLEFHDLLLSPQSPVDSLATPFSNLPLNTNSEYVPSLTASQPQTTPQDSWVDTKEYYAPQIEQLNKSTELSNDSNAPISQQSSTVQEIILTPVILKLSFQMFKVPHDYRYNPTPSGLSATLQQVQDFFKLDPLTCTRANIYAFMVTNQGGYSHSNSCTIQYDSAWHLIALIVGYPLSEFHRDPSQYMKNIFNAIGIGYEAAGLLGVSQALVQKNKWNA